MKKIIVFLTVFVLIVSCTFNTSAVSISGSYNRLYWFDWYYYTSTLDGSVTYNVTLPVERVCISVFDSDLNRIDYGFANGGFFDVPSYGSIQISFFDTAWAYDADESLPWYARFEPSGGQYLWLSCIPKDIELTFSVFVKKVGFKYNNSYFGAYYSKSADSSNPSFSMASQGTTSFNAFSSDEFEITCKVHLGEDCTGAAFSLFLTELTQGNWEISVNAITMSFTVSSSVSGEIEDYVDSQDKKLDDILDSINGSANPVPPSNSGSIDDIGGLEDDIWDSIGSGSNDMNNAFDNAVDAFTAFRGGFAFFIAVFNIFVAPFWIQYLLWISLALGSVAALLGIGLNVAQHESTRIHRDREAWRREKQRTWERKHRKRR